MKKILSLLMALSFCAFQVQAQYDVLDFESPANGTGHNWIVVENASNPAVTFPSNPVSGGINTSATVLEFTALQAGNPWALMYTDDIDPFMFDATNTTVKLKVYKPTLSNIEVKFEQGGGGAPATGVALVANTLANGWEEITYDFSAHIGGTYGRLVIVPDFDFARASDVTLYIDDIQIPDANLATGPAVAAPTPTHNEVTDNVLSIYSDAYTTNVVTGTNFNPNWGQSTAVSTTTISGDDAMTYGSFNYQGTQFSSNVDASGNGYLHLDYWSANLGTFNFYLIDTDPETPVEVSYTVTVSPSAWGSVDIPLFLFASAGLDLSSINQIKVDGGTGAETIYFDNWYFHSNYDAPTAGPSNPTHDETADAVISLFGDSYTTDPSPIDYDPYWGQATDATQQNIGGDNLLQYVGLNYQGTDFAADPQDASASTYLHFDYWASSAVTDFRMFIISINGAGNGSQEHGITPNGSITTGSWQSVDIPVSDFLAGNASIEMDYIAQLKVDDNGTGDGGNVWFDNIYFYTPAPTPPATPDSCLVTWTNLQNTVVENGGRRLRKNVVAAGWSGAAIGQDSIITSADGFLQMEALQTNKKLVFGLAFYNTVADKSSIKFGIELGRTGIAAVRENGHLKHTIGTYNVGDIFRIEKTSNVVTYYQNGTLVYTSLKSGAGKLYADASIKSTFGKVYNAYQSFGCTASASPKTTPTPVNTPTTVAGTSTNSFDEVTVYPNPFHEEVTINYTMDVENVKSIEMYNINGQHIRSIEVSENGQTTIDTYDLEKGMYIISINGTKHYKIMKM